MVAQVLIEGNPLSAKTNGKRVMSENWNARIPRSRCRSRGPFRVPAQPSKLAQRTPVLRQPQL